MISLPNRIIALCNAVVRIWDTCCIVIRNLKQMLLLVLWQKAFILLNFILGLHLIEVVPILQ